ncbi:tRNA (adenosine(37)-N6)-dimethylallyltransferase MiaA [Bacteroidetes bacterium SCGC AAA795-G10]|nr:tRNA (adenosine(37)-N6)-dimethylallyltransferase MiaA [Bacteroidetes bacterium SCGC AAA795-G10]
MKNNTLIYVAGPTSVGKTKFSIELAKKFKTEILSCDSRQFYKETSIGTGVPSKEELSEINHHFIQHKSIREIYTVGDFEKEIIYKINKLFKYNKTLIMVGGSGMYADAVMFGLDKFPEVSKETRNQINYYYKVHGLKSLQNLLYQKDPIYFNIVDKNNPVRLIRALEVSISSGQPYSSFLGKSNKKRNFVSKMILLQCPRKKLYNKINKRVDLMLDKGLEKEAYDLMRYKELTPLKTIGYKELFNHFEGTLSLDDAINEIKKNTRRFAKKQMTWFKKYDNAFRFSSNKPVSEVFNLFK